MVATARAASSHSGRPAPPRVFFMLATVRRRVRPRMSTARPAGSLPVVPASMPPFEDLAPVWAKALAERGAGTEQTLAL